MFEYKYNFSIVGICGKTLVSSLACVSPLDFKHICVCMHTLHVM